LRATHLTIFNYQLSIVNSSGMRWRLIAILIIRSGIAPVGAFLTLLLGLLGGGLCLAAGDVLEVEVLALEVEAGAELVVHVDLLDVGLGEHLHGGLGVAFGIHTGQGALAADAGGEAAEFAEQDGVAFGDGLLDAVAHVGDDAYDGALGVDAVVVGHVVSQGVDVEDAVELQASVRLLGLFRMRGVLLHVQGILECVLHGTNRTQSPLSRSPQGRKASLRSKGCALLCEVVEGCAMRFWDFVKVNN